MKVLDKQGVNKVYSIMFLIFSISLLICNLYIAIQYQTFSVMLVSFNVLCSVGSYLFYENFKALRKGNTSKFH